MKVWDEKKSTQNLLKVCEKMDVGSLPRDLLIKIYEHQSCNTYSS